MQRNLNLIAAVAGLLMITACSTTRTAPASQQPPLACIQRCRIPDPPPRPNDEPARRAWEHETLKRAGQCSTLHDDCAAEALRRMKAE